MRYENVIVTCESGSSVSVRLRAVSGGGRPFDSVDLAALKRYMRAFARGKDVRTRTLRIVSLALGCASCAAASGARSEGAAEPRWSVSLAVGGVDTRDEVRSNDGNVLAIVDETGATVDRFIDPRPDAGVTRTLEAGASGIACVGLEYQAAPRVAVGLSAGYFQSTVGEIGVYLVEADASHVLDAGELTSVPIRLAAVSRFRQRKTLRPYLGAGVHYTVLGFDPSAELDSLSTALDLSSAQRSLLSSEAGGNELVRVVSDPVRGFRGVEVEVGDAFGWNAIGGFEWMAGSRFAVFAELDWAFTTNRLRVSFEDTDELGRSVPQGSALAGSIEAEAPYGAVYIFEGGLLDVDADGAPERGTYYASGGSFTLGGPSLRIGARYRFR
jgi:hypothetical protein